MQAPRRVSARADMWADMTLCSHAVRHCLTTELGQLIALDLEPCSNVTL